MILFNITIQVSWAVHDTWKQWFIEEYLPAILSAGSFIRHQLVRVMEIDEEEGATYALQLYCDDRNKLDVFREIHLPDLRKKERRVWGENTFSFESLMEVIN